LCARVMGFMQHIIVSLIVGILFSLTNQSMIFRARPEVHSRLVGCYMLFYAAGTGIGAALATYVTCTRVGAACACSALQFARLRSRSELASDAGSLARDYVITTSGRHPLMSASSRPAPFVAIGRPPVI
jgi:hypothetical protein